MDMNYMGGHVGGRGWAGHSEVKSGKWANCNSIINKYIFKMGKIPRQGKKLKGNKGETGSNIQRRPDKVNN